MFINQRYMLARFAILTVAVLFFTGCYTTERIMPYHGRPAVHRSYTIDATLKASVGETLFEVGTQDVSPVYTVAFTYDAPDPGLGISQPPTTEGTRYIPFAEFPGTDAELIVGHIDYPTIGIIIDTNGYVTRGWVTMTSALGTIAKSQSPFTRERLFERREPDRLVRKKFRAELLYTGMSGTTLKAVYREYGGTDMIRPAFTTELQYDLNQSKVVSYKSVRLVVDNVQDGVITYHITEDGGLPWLPK